MKELILLLLFGLATALPAYIEIETPRYVLNMTEDFFRKDEKIYTSEHEIVKIVAPPRRFYEDTYTPKDYRDVPMLFFVQGDYKEDGTFDSKGLFVLKIKTGEATKLLDNGVDITLDVNDNAKKVYFAATDGIYIYNAENNTAEKYGSVTDKIISIAKEKNGDAIYALTADKELYKVTENGEKKVKVDNVKNAQQIVLDKDDNIYFYDIQKDVYVFTKNGLNKIDGLPENPNKITLILRESLSVEVPIIVDDTWYEIHGGRLRNYRAMLLAKPTAVYQGYGVGSYFGYKKSIYQSFR